jgi:acyl carrier protein
MNIQNIVIKRLEQAVAEHSLMPFPEDIDDDVELDMFGLDSLAFMELLTNIEKDIGYIPRAILEGDLYPETFGELVSAYETDIT